MTQAPTLSRLLDLLPPPGWLGAGVIATLTMDVGTTLLRRLGLVAGVPISLIARWFGHLLRGRAIHRTIVAAPDVPGQLPLALLCHYLIGISLTLTFVGLAQHAPIRVDSRTRAFVCALGFGVLTNALPWLVMFPAMGFGWLGAQGPPEYRLVRSSFVGHLLFGLGLAMATLWVTSMWTAPADRASR
jgi:hypothetical protein